MTKKISYSTCFSILILLIAGLNFQNVLAQDSNVSVKGIVLESGTGLPLKQVTISVASTGTTADTDENGAFTIVVPDTQAELLVYLPGYNKRNIYLNGRNFLNVSLVSSLFESFDNSFNSPLGSGLLKNSSFAVSTLNSSKLKESQATSFDQALQGRISGLSVIEQSGMPGHKTFMNVRGISSIYANTEPLLFIDGMIHDYTYAQNSLMEGYSSNPFDIVDIADITDITVSKDGTAYLGALGTNGVINVNTEQKSETSTIINLSVYGGMSFAPGGLSVLNASQFKSYFTDVYNTNKPNNVDINSRYPWLNGGTSASEYYRYSNNTDWQEQTYKPATLTKFHFFLKGGDDIATYNISTGYVKQKGIFDESSYSRFNLRINGKINISDKFSITPNAKLSLSDSKYPNLGPSAWKNPILASIQKSPLMGSFARDNATGAELPYLDDIGAFNISSPTAIVNNSQGTDRNYHFLSSVMAQYKFSERLILSTLQGIDFNNSRQNIFLPDLGMVQVDSAKNSPGDFVNEFRSSQNHTTLNYNKKSDAGHSINLFGGFRYMKNTYKYDKVLSLNTPSDDFKNLDNGTQYPYLRSAVGESRGVAWVSYFGTVNYNFREKYTIASNISYDGNSAVNKGNRYNFYPSISAAWRVSSEKFLSNAKWLENMKLRGSWSETGNMLSSIYDYSKLYYIAQRSNDQGVILREAIPNENLELEKKATMNAGLDLSLFKQVLNLHVDVYKSNVDNLIIGQELPETFGYTNYFDNGGKLETKGIEVSADTRFHIGNLVWTLGGSITNQTSKVTGLTFINPETEHVITSIEGGQFITSVGNAPNSYYGYKTEGIISSADARKITGPKGVEMQEGDVKFVDVPTVDTGNKDENGNPIFIGDDRIDEKDKMIIGNPNPDFFGGFNTSLIYKNFELNAYFSYSVGNDIFNYVRYKAESMDSYANQFTSVLDRWTPSNNTATMPRAAYGDPSGNASFSDRWIEDGSYVRLKQLSLNYTLPRVSGLYKGITIYVTGTNLLTFTNYSGNDPDFLYSNNPFYMGVDYGKIPQNKSLILGLKLDL